MMEIPVIFENDALVVIDKPSGVMVHPARAVGEDGVSDGETIVDWLLARAPEVRGVGEPGRSPKGEELERSGVVHRLDRETSGVLVLAKTQNAFEYLKEEFQNRRAEKEYRAFVYGTMKEKWGTIDRPIGRSAKDFRKRSAEPGSRGTRRDALTDWERIGQNYTHAYLKVTPRTGRTHQIRVHLKAIGRPVVMDELYAPSHFLSGDDLGFTRLALHAHVLTIAMPSGEVKRFIAPLPPEFEQAAERIAEV